MNLEKKFKNFNLQILLASKPNKAKSNSHCSEWKSLVSVMSQKSADVNNQQTVRRYFNIGQGGASTNVVLDAIALSKVLERLRKAGLSLSLKKNKTTIGLNNVEMHIPS